MDSIGCKKRWCGLVERTGRWNIIRREPAPCRTARRTLAAQPFGKVHARGVRILVRAIPRFDYPLIPRG